VLSTVRSQPQDVLMAKLYRPALVNGCRPPPPRPVWSVNLTSGAPCSVELNMKVPRCLAAFWQSNFHTTVHSAGSATEERARLPVPEWCRYTIVAGLGGAEAPAAPHTAIEPAKSATAMGKRTVLEKRGRVLVARRGAGPVREVIRTTFLGWHRASTQAVPLPAAPARGPVERHASSARDGPEVHRGDSNDSVDT
jgi:hypothetical protein